MVSGIWRVEPKIPDSISRDVQEELKRAVLLHSIAFESTLRASLVSLSSLLTQDTARPAGLGGVKAEPDSSCWPAMSAIRSTFVGRFEWIYMMHARESLEVVVRRDDSCTLLDREGGDMCI